MSRRAIEARVRRVLAATLGCAEADLAKGAKIKQTEGWDSLAHVQLMLALEKEFGVWLHAETIMKLTTLDRIISHFEAASASSGDAAARAADASPAAAAGDLDLGGFAAAFRASLGDLGIEQGDLLLVHSFLGPLRALAADPITLCETITHVLREVLGPSGTLVMPAFTGVFTRTGRIDRAQAPSETGVLTEYLRTRPDAVQTPHPVHRFAALGPHAADLVASPCPSAFGPGSPLHVMHRLGGKILLLAVDWECCTFFHYVEEQFEVSYRFYKDMTGEVITPEGAGKETWQEFAGDWGYGVEDSFNAFGKRVEKGGICEMGWAGPARLRSVRMDALFEFVYAALEQDERCLLESA